MYLLSTGAYLPGQCVTNDMLVEYFGSSVNLIADYFGVKSRYMAVDYQTGKDLGEYTSDFGAKAALEAISKVPHFNLNQVGLIISASSTPDYTLPSLSSLIQEKLDLQHAIPIDIRGGCSGAIQALLTAELFIQSGRVNYALVIGGECCSTIYYDFLFKQRQSYNAKDLLNTLIFGDGAAAFLVGASAPNHEGFEIECVTSGSVLHTQSPGFVFSLGGSKEKILGVESIALSELFRHFPKQIDAHLPQVIRAMQDDLHRHGYGPKDFKTIIGPQANKRLIDTMNGLLQQHKADYFYYGDITGNIPGGALFLTFDHAQKLNPADSGDKVLMMGMESPKWLYGYCILRKR